MSIKILRNCLIFDGFNEALIEGGSIVIEGDKVREVRAGNANIAGADVIHMGGRFVMPGLLDIHFHVYGISLDMHLLDNMTMPVKVAGRFSRFRVASQMPTQSRSP